jgi:hypothetical protein
VSQESRRETLRKYKLYFGTPGAAPNICLNVAIDTVEIDRNALRMKAIRKPELSQIQHIEISGENLWFSPAPNVMTGLLSFSALQTVTVATPVPPVLSYPRDKETGGILWQDLARELTHEKAVREVCAQFSILKELFKEYKAKHPDWKEPKLQVVILAAGARG